MTKAELLYFLAPFSDDIQIVLRTRDGIEDYHPHYYLRPHPLRLCKSNVLIERGDGYVELVVMR